MDLAVLGMDSGCPGSGFAVLGEDLAGLGVDLPGCLRVDLAVLGVDLPVSGNVAVWEWYFAANFGGEFRFWQ